nr:MAG TPA: hypothetical protein [Caudoviricetes sp.]
MICNFNPHTYVNYILLNQMLLKHTGISILILM